MLLYLVIIVIVFGLFIYYNTKKYKIEQFSNNDCARAYILNYLCTISLTDNKNNYNSSTIEDATLGIKIQNYTNLNPNKFYRDSLVYVGHNSILDTGWLIVGGTLNSVKIYNYRYNVFLGYGDLDNNPIIKKSVYVTSTYNKNCQWSLIQQECSVYTIKHIKTSLYLYSYQPNIENTFVDQQTPLLYYKLGILTCNKKQQNWLILPQKPVIVKSNNPNNGNNRWSFLEAVSLCNNIGMELCSMNKLDKYYKLGYSNCSCSWIDYIKGNTVYTGYPKSNNNNNGCGSFGVNSCSWKNIISASYLCDKITYYISGDLWGNRWKISYLSRRVPWQNVSLRYQTIGNIGTIIYAYLRDSNNNYFQQPLYIKLYYRNSPYTGNVSNVRLLCRGSGVTCCPKPIFMNAKCINFGGISWVVDDQWYNQLNRSGVGGRIIWPFFYNELINKADGFSIMGKICNNSNTSYNSGEGMVFSGTKYNNLGYWLLVLYCRDKRYSAMRKFIYFRPPVYLNRKCNTTYWNFPSIRSTKILKTFGKPPCQGISNNNAVMAGAPFYKVLGSRQNCIKACQNMRNCRAATGKMVSNNINKYNKGTNYKYCWLAMKGGPGKYSTGYNGWWSWRKQNVCDGKRNNCIPFTADTCRKAGKKLGYSIGGYGFPFISNSSNQSAFASGCYIYGNNTVFFGNYGNKSGPNSFYKGAKSHKRPFNGCSNKM